MAFGHTRKITVWRVFPIAAIRLFAICHVLENSKSASVAEEFDDPLSAKGRRRQGELASNYMNVRATTAMLSSRDMGGIQP